MARRRSVDDVPRLPRGSWLRVSLPELVRILMVAVALIALIVLQKPCAQSVSKFVLGFQEPDAGIDGPAAPAMPVGVHLRADMTPAELEAAIAAARGQVAADAGVDAPLDGAPAAP